MENVIDLDHARASSSLRAAKPAKTSSVTSLTPRSAAKDTTAAQWPAGMPLVRQPLTTDASCPKAGATTPVPPRSFKMDSHVIMPDNIVRTVRTCQGFAKCETTILPVYGAMGTMTDPDHIIAARLRALRIALGYKHQNAFAAELDIEKNTYNPFETGKRSLTFEVAVRIRRRFGISVDWMFFGDMGQASSDIIMKIGSNPGEGARPANRKK